MIRRGFSLAFNSGDLPAADALADQALELALREGSPGVSGCAHALQMHTRYQRGDLAGVEQHFTAWLKFFEIPFSGRSRIRVIAIFGHASHNAWTLGRADVARERMAQMMAAANRTTRTTWRSQGYCAARL